MFRLREARENANRIFPFTPELWLEWLTDESKIASSEDEKMALNELFERAVKDYMSVPIWLEYAQFSIGNMGLKDGLENVRNIFERALTAVGLHVTQGALIWEAFREFELVILNTIKPLPEVESNPEQQQQIKQQTDRIMSIFHRQLSIPLLDMEKTFEEYKEWLDNEVHSSVEQSYKRAKNKLSKLQPFEDSLICSESPHLQEYYKYIEFEEKGNDPARVQCIYERALTDNCLVPDLWQKYTKYLDTQLKIDNIVLPVHERAVRNCPWSVTLWINYILAMERHKQSHENIKEIIERSLQAGFSQAEEFRLLWLACIDYLRRRIKWEEDKEDTLQELRDTFQRAVNHLRLYFDAQNDYSVDILQYWARIEAKKCKNMEKARELWNEIISHGHGSEAQMWIEFANLERAYGDEIRCRQILIRGLHSASDWPEAVGEALLNFEREEGTLETFDIASEKYNVHMKRIKERRQKKAEKEQRIEEEQKKIAKAEKKAARAEKKAAKAALKAQNTLGKENLKRKKSNTLELEDSAENMVQVDSEGFKIPPVPGTKGAQLKGPLKQDEIEMEPETKKQKLEENDPAAHGVIIHHDSKKDERTVFLSNLSYHIEEEQIREIFNEIGEITDLRLVRDYKGRPKGFCYVEFATQENAVEALKKDRMPLEGRPMFISPCEDKKNNPNRTNFKFRTGLEKNKLFVKGIPQDMTVEELKEMFNSYGPLKDVRLVTYRNGHSKGLAYIEYEDENSASAALVKTDGSKIREHIISVAISNPPERKQRKRDGNKTSTQLSSILGGGGGSIVGPRGRGRTQLTMVPRALQQVSRVSKQNGESNGTESKNKKMSNDDFRRLLQN